MLTKLQSSALAFGVAFTSLQIVQPSVKSISPAEPSNAMHLERVAGTQVATVLERSCKDCHSYDTTWPWYSHIAPVSWMLGRHVRQGRAKLNFSEWAPGKQTTNQVAEICDAVSDGSMPLRGYAVLHPEAKLSSQDVDLICDWAATRMAHKQPPSP
jgi:hypothetical protein